MSSKPIRVLQVFICMDRSGVPVMLMNYYRNINRSAVQFDFAVESSKEEKYDKEILSLGGKIYRIGIRGTKIGYYWKLAKIIKEGKYNIVHAHMNYRNLPILTTALLCGVKNRVSHSHGAYLFHGFIQKTIRAIIRGLLNVIITTRLSCSELAGRNLYGDKAFNKGLVKVINNAIDLQKYNFNKQIRKEKRKALDIDGKIVWGHVGNFINLKNHKFLVDSFAEFSLKHKNSVLVLVGKGGLFDTIKNRVAEKGIENNVLFLGSRDDTYELYQAFDLFVLPSVAEGFAIVLLEAMAAGLKCIISDCLTDEMNVSGLITQLSLELGPKRWADRAEEIIDIKKDRKPFSNLLTKRGYNIEKEAHTLVRVYQGMKGKNGER